MIEQVFESLLTGSTALQALVGGSIFGLLVPTGTDLPALDYKVVSATAAPTWSSVGSQRFRFEVNCWAAKYDQAVAIRSAVITALNGYADGTTSVQFLSSQDLFENELDQMRCVAEFYVHTSNF